MNNILMPEFDEVRRKIEKALRLLYKNDLFLITNTTNERSITHKFAEYIQFLFPEWNVDCEYNRKGEGESKKIDGQKTSYPDIIVHLRNTKHNLLIIEAKKSSACHNDVKEDKAKIKKYIENQEYGYKFGLWVCFYEEIEKTKMDWFKNQDGKCEQMETK